MQITRETLRTWDACYSDERIDALVPPDGLTPLEVCDCASVPVGDRLWVLLREEVIPARELRLLACRWAEQACDAASVGPGASRDAIAVARRYAVGEATGEELSAAREAARDAAWAAEDAQLADVRRVLVGGEPVVADERLPGS